MCWINIHSSGILIPLLTLWSRKCYKQWRSYPNAGLSLEGSLRHSLCTAEGRTLVRWLYHWKDWYSASHPQRSCTPDSESASLSQNSSWAEASVGSTYTTLNTFSEVNIWGPDPVTICTFSPSNACSKSTLIRVAFSRAGWSAFCIHLSRFGNSYGCSNLFFANLCMVSSVEQVGQLLL